MANVAQALDYETLLFATILLPSASAGGLISEKLELKIEAVALPMRSWKASSFWRELRWISKPMADWTMPTILSARCDVVVASVHMGAQQTERAITGRLISAIENENVDIIGHPTGRIIDQRGPSEMDMQEVLKAAARTKTALEINSYPSRLDLSDVNCQGRQRDGCKIEHKLRCS